QALWPRGPQENPGRKPERSRFDSNGERECRRQSDRSRQWRQRLSHQAFRLCRALRASATPLPSRRSGKHLASPFRPRDEHANPSRDPRRPQNRFEAERVFPTGIPSPECAAYCHPHDDHRTRLGHSFRLGQQCCGRPHQYVAQQNRPAILKAFDPHGSRGRLRFVGPTLMKAMNLGLRLTLFYSAMMTVMLAFFCLLFYHSLGLVVENRLTQELRQRVNFLNNFQHVEAGGLQLVFNPADREQSYLVHSAARYYQVFQLPSGQLLVQSQEIELLGIELSPQDVRSLAGAP